MNFLKRLPQLNISRRTRAPLHAIYLDVCVGRGMCIKHIRGFPRRKRTVNRHANGVSKARQCTAEEETSENYWSYCCAFAVYCYCHGAKNNFSPIGPFRFVLELSFYCMHFIARAVNKKLPINFCAITLKLHVNLYVCIS